MGDRTEIAWTEMVWNPTTGCTKVSRGCAHCYAERWFSRAYGGQLIEFNSKPVLGSMTMSNIRRRQFTDVQTHADRLDAPLHWKKPRRIFVNSMSDLFHEAVPDEFIGKVFQTMRAAHWHKFQILTKRADRMRKLLSDGDTFAFHFPSGCGCLCHEGSDSESCQICESWHEWPLPNVHLGVSIEDQETADERIPLLLQTPAAVRFISYEPALGPVDLREISKL